MARKDKEHIWDEESLLAFHNTFADREGKDTLANILYELGFWDDKLETHDEMVERNYATALLKRLAFGDEAEMHDMIAGLLNRVKPIKKKEKNDE